MASTQSAAVDLTFWDEKLETQSWADWDGLKFDLLKKYLHHAYANSPYYKVSFDAAGVRDIVYISASSGSTGVPTASPFTAQDFDDRMDYEARQFRSSGLRPDDHYFHSLNFSLPLRQSNHPPAKPGAFRIAAPSKGADRNPKSKAPRYNRERLKGKSQVQPQ